MRHQGYAGQLAAWIVETRDAPLSEGVREAALRALLDLLGSAAAGVNDPGPAAVRRAASAFGPGQVPVWFTGTTASPLAAAWANAAAAASQDLDDGSRPARGHPGAAVIPAALAVGAETGASFDRILAAIAIGYEVGVTIGAARTTYGNSGTWTAFAVVAAAAALRGTPADQIEHALAIAGESAPNQLFASAPPPRDPSPEGSDVKEGIPWSVVTGLMALSLAEAGHTGPRNLLEATRQYRFAGPFQPGAEPQIARIYFKLYACCRHIHSPLDALFGLIDAHQLRAGEIDEIAVECTSGALRISNLTAPENLTDLQYSIPYCMALAVLSGPQIFLPLTREALSVPGAQELAARVTLHLNEEFDAKFPAETLARVTVRSGTRVLQSPVTSPKGEATAPLTWDELCRKAQMAGRMTLAPARLAALPGAVRNVLTDEGAALMACLAGAD